MYHDLSVKSETQYMLSFLLVLCVYQSEILNSCSVSRSENCSTWLLFSFV